MGMLVEGVWNDIPRAARATGGAFLRPESAFRDRVLEPRGEIRPGRYRLYVAKSCPWAHRTLIVRARGQDYSLLAGAEGAEPVTVAVVDGRALDSVATGGFLGLWIGAYATSNGRPTATVAHVERFEYLPAR